MGPYLGYCRCRFLISLHTTVQSRCLSWSLPDFRVSGQALCSPCFLCSCLPRILHGLDELKHMADVGYHTDMVLAHQKLLILEGVNIGLIVACGFPGGVL